MRTRATCPAWAVCALGLASLIAGAGCDTKSSPADAGASASHPSGTPIGTSSGPRSMLAPLPSAPVIDRRPIWMRDSGTRVPFITPLPMASGMVGATGGDGGLPAPILSAPGWDLSPDDPGRDYARRYVFFTKRYPDLACAELSPGVVAGDRKQVTVTTAASCPGAGTVRDVFLVDVAGDHLTVDDKSKRNPLALWPDGSDPEGPPNAEIRETGDMKRWKSPIEDALIKAALAPLRMQSYGRGTYPLVSIAAWRAPYVLNAPPDALQTLSDALCAANDNMPMALVAGFDRAHVLRIRCPSTTKWDTLK